MVVAAPKVQTPGLICRVATAPVPHLGLQDSTADVHWHCQLCECDLICHNRPVWFQTSCLRNVTGPSSMAIVSDTGGHRHYRWEVAQAQLRLPVLAYSVPHL